VLPSPRAIEPVRTGPRYVVHCDGCSNLTCRWLPSDSKSNHSGTPMDMLCPVCGGALTRSQGLKRHILDVHLPDWVCCPHPTCAWHDSRKKQLDEHIESSEKCSAKPEWVDQYQIYDAELTLHWLLIDSVPFETVETFALGMIEERARELGKVDVWGPVTKWQKRPTPRRKQMSRES
jgi:hypothetical protein